MFPGKYPTPRLPPAKNAHHCLKWPEIELGRPQTFDSDRGRAGQLTAGTASDCRHIPCLTTGSSHLYPNQIHVLNLLSVLLI